MKTTREKEMFQYKHVVHEENGTLTVGGITGVPNIAEAGIGQPAAWFLGPRAENEDLLRHMIDLAITRAVEYRNDYEPRDPKVITDTVKATDEYKNAVENMIQAYGQLVEFIKGYTTPYFSMRYQGHMLWDNTLPALCAYFATMLHNPNNVTIQASTATTALEILVGWDLCGMVGFAVNPMRAQKEFDPWSHITCDGSVANIETSWACRETKFFPFALRRLLTETKAFQFKDGQGQPIEIPIDNQAHPIIVTTCDRRPVCLTETDMDSWTLFNISMDEILGLPKRIAGSYDIDDEYVVWSAAVPFTLNYVGWPNMARYIQTISADARMPVMIAPSTMHYSWPKAAAFTGYGFGEPGAATDGRSSQGGVINIPVDADARMSMDDLESTLQSCHDEKIPITLVVGVTGSTEEGAVDPLETILAKRKSCRSRGLEYFVHADAAWGGYMVTAMRRPYILGDSVRQAELNPDMPPYDPSDPFVPAETSALSDYVYTQYSQIRRCDSVTIDPHKMGYVQYPAGAILYRNGTIRRLTTFTGAYIGGTGSVDPGTEPTVGIFGLEGSRPGASAAAVFLNHRTIRPDVTGHGKIVEQSLINTRIFAVCLLALSHRSRYFRVTLLTRNTDTNAEVNARGFLEMAPQEMMAALIDDPPRNFGPDLNVLDYVFNPLYEDLTPNHRLDALNDFNVEVYNRFHVPVSESPARKLPVEMKDFPKFFVTKTTFGRSEYGGVFIDNFVKRIFGGAPQTGGDTAASVECLRSVVMDPFMPYAEKGDFIMTIVDVIDETVTALVKEWRARHTRPL